MPPAASPSHEQMSRADAPSCRGPRGGRLSCITRHAARLALAVTRRLMCDACPRADAYRGRAKPRSRLSAAERPVLPVDSVTWVLVRNTWPAPPVGFRRAGSRGPSRVDNGDMATTELPESVDIRIETSQPGADRLSIHLTPAFAEEIATAFENAGGQVSHDILEHSVPDVMQSVLEVAGPIAASGVAIARVLKQWWHRNDAKRVTATFNGESISLEGMSTEQMAQIIDLAHQRWDKRWREQFPDRFPDDNCSSGDGEIE